MNASLSAISLFGCTDSTTQLCGWIAWFVNGASKFLLNDKAMRDYAVFGSILLATVALEIAARKNWRVRYRSYNFRVDMIYYVFYYSGLYHIFFFTWIFKGLNHLVLAYAPGLRTEFLSGLSLPMQIVAITLASDFLFYWYHRMMHSNRYFWAFHSIHHSQTTLTVVTGFRYHIIDETLHRISVFIPFQILGFTNFVDVWLAIDFVLAWVFLVQHSEWNWSYGPVGRFFVSPKFHRIHHSTDADVANHNYSAIFSFWDDLFGTAERKAPSPTQYGLSGDPIPETLLGHFLHPFKEIARDIGQRVHGAKPTVPPAGTPAE